MPPRFTEREKSFARDEVNRAVREGRLPRPELCEACGCVGPSVYHHHDYGQPLDVIPLCRTCHQRVHNGTIPEPRTGRMYSSEAIREHRSKMKRLGHLHEAARIVLYRLAGVEREARIRPERLDAGLRFLETHGFVEALKRDGFEVTRGNLMGFCWDRERVEYGRYLKRVAAADAA